ncbi:MAG: hypothetical protein ACRD1E_03185 [Terriglobales bacterium]
MGKKRSSKPRERGPKFNRFQTAVSGLGFVKTAVDAHFDAYAEHAATGPRTLAKLEAVARVTVGEAG